MAAGADPWVRAASALVVELGFVWREQVEDVLAAEGVAVCGVGGLVAGPLGGQLVEQAAACAAVEPSEE